MYWSRMAKQKVVKQAKKNPMREVRDDKKWEKIGSKRIILVSLY